MPFLSSLHTYTQIKVYLCLNSLFISFNTPRHNVCVHVSLSAPLSHTQPRTHTESVWCQSASSLPLTKLERELLRTQAELNKEVLKLEAETRDEERGWGGWRGWVEENSGGCWGGGCLCVHCRGVGRGHALNTIGYHCGGPSLIHIPLMPAGNLLDRHALSMHTQTCSETTPTLLHSSFPLLESGDNGMDRFCFRWGTAADWSL